MGRPSLLLALSLLGACASEPDAGLDVSIFDAGNNVDLDGSVELDAEADAGLDVGFDGGVDSGEDAGADAADGAGLDAGEDAGPQDADLDGAVDAADDAGLDGGIDAAADGGGPGPVPTGYSDNVIDETARGGRGVSVVDIEDDGDLDVLASFDETDTVRLYVNGGTSGFQPIDLAVPGSIVAMDQVAADFDDDGDLDVAAVGLYTRAIGINTPGDIVWYQSPGAPTGTWATMPISTGVLYGLDTIASADLTGDGLPDLVVGCNEAYDMTGTVVGHGVYYVANTGSGSFGAPVAIDEPLGGVEVVVVADVDLDGVPDVVASSRNDSELVWYENLRAPGTIEPIPAFLRHTIANPNLPTGIAFGQLDFDPALELASVEDDTLGGRLVWYDPPADPTMPWLLTEIDPAFGGSGLPIRVVLADLNRDGYDDLAVASAVHGQVRAYIQQAAGAWTMQDVAPSLVGAGAVTAGDVDGDAFNDLVTSTNDFDPAFDRISWWFVQP